MGTSTQVRDVQGSLPQNDEVPEAYAVKTGVDYQRNPNTVFAGLLAQNTALRAAHEVPDLSEG